MKRDYRKQRYLAEGLRAYCGTATVPQCYDRLELDRTRYGSLGRRASLPSTSAFFRRLVVFVFRTYCGYGDLPLRMYSGTAGLI
jgi:hypothetical protein